MKNLKKQKGEIVSALVAALLGAAFTALSITTVSCDFEPAGHPQCTTVDAQNHAEGSE